MRWYGQLALVAVLGASRLRRVGYAYKDGTLATASGRRRVRGRASPAQAAAAGRGAAGRRRRSSTSTPSGPAASSRSATRSAPCAPSSRSPSPPRAPASSRRSASRKGRRSRSATCCCGSIPTSAAPTSSRPRPRPAARARCATSSSVRLDRAMALRRTGAGTGAQVEDLTAQVRTLESAIASAEARRKAAEARLEDLIVRAPFNGRLGTRSVSLGAYVSPGHAHHHARRPVPGPARFRRPGEHPRRSSRSARRCGRSRPPSAQRVFEGRVAVIDPRVDPVTRSVRLTAEFPNPDEALKPGMFLSVALEVSVKDDAVIVPEEAIVGEGLRHLVYVVKDNMVERRVVRIGQRQEGRVEVVDGLKPGEIVIVRGVQRVRPGQTVDAEAGSSAERGPAAEAAADACRSGPAHRRSAKPQPGLEHRRRRAPRLITPNGVLTRHAGFRPLHPPAGVLGRRQPAAHGRRACRPACSCRCASIRRSTRRSSRSTPSTRRLERGHREPRHRAHRGRGRRASRASGRSPRRARTSAPR